MALKLLKRIPFLLSFGSALLLLLTPSIINIALIASALFIVYLAVVFNWIETDTDNKKSKNNLAIACSLIFLLFGLIKFYITWMPSQMVQTISNMLNIEKNILIVLMGLVSCLIGFYAVYILVNWGFFKRKKYLPEKNEEKLLLNFKKNLPFAISATAFFCLNITNDPSYEKGIPVTVIIWLVFITQVPSIWNGFIKQSRLLKIFSVLSSAGICWVGQSLFCGTLGITKMAAEFKKSFNTNFDISLAISIFLAVLSFYFVCVFISFFCNEMKKIITKSLFSDVSKAEYIVYSVILLASIVFMSIVFFKTKAFYGVKDSVDIIYTSDSNALIRKNVYISINHVENDLRQPLFALFAAPFMGMFCFFGKLFNCTQTLQVILINCVQILMLLFANFMLTKMMGLNSIKRICFITLFSSTYMYLLFILMMEQYIVTYFWLILCIYLICEGKPSSLALVGAGGTMLTDMILMPFAQKSSPKKDFKKWIYENIKTTFLFIFALLAFGRGNVVFTALSKTKKLTKFTGTNISFADKIYQYTDFVHNCFSSPKAGRDFTSFESASWQLDKSECLDWIGIGILIVALLSFIINRKKTSSRIFALWVVFSFALLLVLGWGTKENGLILYSIYFGWAFFVLIFQLVEKIEEKCKVKFITPLISAIGFVALMWLNIPAIKEMVDFGIEYYPV